MPHGIRKRVIKDNGIKPATHMRTYEKEQEKKNASVPGGTTATADHTSTFRVLLLLPLMVLLVLFGVVGTLRMRQHSVQPTSRNGSMKVFTTEELGMYDGKHRRGGPLYLAILGSVFDVTQGKRHYGMFSVFTMPTPPPYVCMYIYIYQLTHIYVHIQGREGRIISLLEGMHQGPTPLASLMPTYMMIFAIYHRNGWQSSSTGEIFISIVPNTPMLGV